MTRKRQVKKAIAQAGGRGVLAKRVGVSPEAIRQWEVAGHIPDRRVLQVEEATNDIAGHPQTTRHELRPDLYPEERTA